MDALNSIAPVLAIKGNVDTGPWTDELPFVCTKTVAGIRIYVVHKLADLEFDPANLGYQAVISGHSHKPSHEFRAGMLYLNPGSAGPPRFRLPLTVARLIIDGDRLTPGDYSSNAIGPTAFLPRGSLNQPYPSELEKVLRRLPGGRHSQ
jgi:uncharacterized protein